MAGCARYLDESISHRVDVDSDIAGVCICTLEAYCTDVSGIPEFSPRPPICGISGEKSFVAEAAVGSDVGVADAGIFDPGAVCVEVGDAPVACAGFTPVIVGGGLGA